MARRDVSPDDLEHRIAKLDEAIDLVVRSVKADDPVLRAVLSLERLTQSARLALIAERTEDFAALSDHLDDSFDRVLRWFFDGALPDGPIETGLGHSTLSTSRLAEATSPPPPEHDHAELLSRCRRSIRPMPQPEHGSGVREKTTLPSAGCEAPTPRTRPRLAALRLR
jgi:hypothetical protein